MKKLIKESDVIAVICKDCYADCRGTCTEVEKIKALAGVQPSNNPCASCEDKSDCGKCTFF